MFHLLNIRFESHGEIRILTEKEFSGNAGGAIFDALLIGVLSWLHHMWGSDRSSGNTAGPLEVLQPHPGITIAHTMEYELYPSRR